MPEANHPATDHPVSTRLRATTRSWRFVILVLLGQVAWQQMAYQFPESRRRADSPRADERVERLANDKLQSHREEMVNAVAFVDDLYRSPDGLQRPGGLYIADAKRIDAEAIGTWILDVYMQARIAGKSDAEARQSIADAIKGIRGVAAQTREAVSHELRRQD
jgi:hypothetical protein